MIINYVHIINIILKAELYDQKAFSAIKSFKYIVPFATSKKRPYMKKVEAVQVKVGQKMTAFSRRKMNAFSRR